MHRGELLISVQEEIEHVKNYVAIEIVCKPNKFDIIYEIDEAILHIPIVKIILQPIVENCIKHGFAKKKDKGLITLRGYMDEDFLYFEIIDNGKGANENPLQQDLTTVKGYGLRNVQERINLHYGKDGIILFESKLGKGTKITIKLKLSQFS